MSGAHPLSAPSGRNMFADYERDTSGAVALLTTLRGDPAASSPPEKARLKQVAMLACALWEFRTADIQDASPEWRARRQQDRARLLKLAERGGST